MRKLDGAGILPGAHLPVGRIDARRVDVDDDFPGRGDRVRQLPVLEDLRAAEAAEEGGFHPRGEPRFSRSFTSARSTRLAGVGTPSASPLRTTKPFRWSISVGVPRARSWAVEEDCPGMVSGMRGTVCSRSRGDD